MECAKERYTLWAMNYIRNPKMFGAAFGLIQSCILNKKYEDASLYAHTAHEMVSNDADGIIPSEKRESLFTQACYWLSVAIHRLTEAGGIPPEEMQKAGEKAIALARQALEIDTQLHGTESIDVADDMTTLANALDYFNNVDDDEVLHRYEQTIAIRSRLEGSSINMAKGEQNLGATYFSRACRAVANDQERCVMNLELSLPHFREALRCYRINNCTYGVDEILRRISTVEQGIDVGRTAVAAAAAGV